MSARPLAPALLLAAGILVGTAVAASLADRGTWALTGPVVLAAAMGGAWRLRPGGDRRVLVALVVSVLTAGAILVLSDPHDAVAMLPVLGACGMPLVTGEGCGSRCTVD